MIWQAGLNPFKFLSSSYSLQCPVQIGVESRLQLPCSGRSPIVRCNHYNSSLHCTKGPRWTPATAYMALLSIKRPSVVYLLLNLFVGSANCSLYIICHCSTLWVQARSAISPIKAHFANFFFFNMTMQILILISMVRTTELTMHYPCEDGPLTIALLQFSQNSWNFVVVVFFEWCHCSAPRNSRSLVYSLCFDYLFEPSQGCSGCIFVPNIKNFWIVWMPSTEIKNSIQSRGNAIQVETLLVVVIKMFEYCTCICCSSHCWDI